MALKAVCYRERPWRPFHSYLIPFLVSIILFWSPNHFVFYSVPPITFNSILIPQLIVSLSNLSLFLTQKIFAIDGVWTRGIQIPHLCLNHLSYQNRQETAWYFRALSMRERKREVWRGCSKRILPALSRRTSLSAHLSRHSRLSQRETERTTDRKRGD